MNLKCETTNRAPFWLQDQAVAFQYTVPGLTSFQRVIGVDGSTDTDPGLMLIKMNDLITVKRLQQNTVQHLVPQADIDNEQEPE